MTPEFVQQIDRLQQKCRDCAETILQTLFLDDPATLAAIERNRDAWETGVEAGIAGTFLALQQMGFSAENGMAPHDHTERVPGCFRCDLSSDES